MKRWVAGRGGPLLMAGVLGIMGSLACAGVPRPARDASPEVRFRYGWTLLERGNTYQARQVFEELSLAAAGSAVIDSIRYGLAETYFRESNYHQSRVEYEAFVSAHPRSHLVDDAAFKIGLCYWELSLGYKLDQSETRQAIDAFQSFMMDYPTSDLADRASELIYEAREKLARKKLYEGETYYQLGTERDLRAAGLVLTEMIQTFGGSRHLDRAVWLLAEVHLKLDERDRARELFAAFIQAFPDSSLRSRVQARLRELGPSDPPPEGLRPLQP